MKLKNIIFAALALLLVVNISFSQEKETFEEIIWHVKAYRPDAQLLKVKAIDKNGKHYDIKAIQNSDQTSLLDVKAFIGDKRLPVKMLVSNDKYHPVKAIGEDGTIYDIKAITPDGKVLPVKGVSKSGNIVHIRAIYQDKVFYNIIAVSPDGKTNAVKGIKLSDDNVEATVNGVQVFAHIKSIPQTK